MHIGIDSRLPFYRQGGISQYVQHLVVGLARLDAENRYAVLQSRKDEICRVPNAGNFSRRDLWTPCHHRLERWTLSAELLPRNLDVLHSPDFIPPAFGAKRHIITIHDLNFIYYPEFLTPESMRYYAGQVKWAVRRADHISADSHATREDLIERLQVHPEKVTTIHLAANPIYQETQPDSAVEGTLGKYNLPRGFILFVGTLEPRKNLTTLIQAYRRFLDEGQIDPPVVLVGSKGWIYEEIFETIEEYGLRKRVFHLSGLDDGELARLYRAAGLLALPSHYEGFGLPVLEAMHCDCPVIVSDVGSLPEVAGDAAIMLPPNDVDAWAEAMLRVLTDGELATTMKVKGRHHVSRFTWENTAAATLQLYQDA